MTPHAPTITAKLPAYTPAQARALENHYIRNIPGAGRSRVSGRAPTEAVPVSLNRKDTEKVLAALDVHQPISANALADFVPGVSAKRVRQHMAKLEAAGSVKRIGNGSSTQWVVADIIRVDRGKCDVILHKLHRHGPTRFATIREWMPGNGRSSVNSMLTQLHRDGLVRKVGGGNATKWEAT